ncbi:MAG: hypothetical protein KAI81_05740, partial [Candidatus Marinimicrobia bacterium]|nr:hypothetical protein [Candidatus Neomarinimicrobiota bacterium]
DYKLPQLLLREESFLCDDLDISHLAGQYPSRDYGRDGDKIFNEARVWNILSQNGLIRDLANSFLVFAFPGDGNIKDITDPWLVKAFSGRRQKRYLIETKFYKEQDEIVVEKKACYPLASEKKSGEPETVIHHLGKMEYVQGVPYGYTLLDQVSKENSLAQFVTYLTPWVEWLRANALSQSVSEGGEKLLVPGKLYDCMPANFLINKQKELCIIDQEWEYKAPLELGFVFFRGIYREVSANFEYFEQTDIFKNRTILDILDHIYTVFELPFNQELFNDYLDHEVTFQLEVGTYGVGRKGLIEKLHTFFYGTRTLKSGVAELLISGGIGRHTLLVEQEKVL